MSTYINELGFKWRAGPYDAFKQYLTVANPVLNINPALNNRKLTPQEIEVLGAFIYIDYEYRSLPKETRNVILFSRTTKKKIIDKLKTTNDAINNVISSLYKKGYISKDKRLLTVVPFDGTSINISYKISLTDKKEEDLLKTVSDDETMESSF